MSTRWSSTAVFHTQGFQSSKTNTDVGGNYAKKEKLKVQHLSVGEIKKFNNSLGCTTIRVCTFLHWVVVEPSSTYTIVCSSWFYFKNSIMSFGVIFLTVKSWLVYGFICIYYLIFENLGPKCAVHHVSFQPYPCATKELTKRTIGVVISFNI